MLQAVGQLVLVEAGVEQPRQHADIDAPGPRGHRHAFVRGEAHGRVDAPTVDDGTQARTRTEMTRHEPAKRTTRRARRRARAAYACDRPWNPNRRSPNRSRQSAGSG